MGSDNLNAIIFSLVVNDAFFNFRKTEYSGQVYKKDRGIVFEDRLNQNLGGVFSGSLQGYRVPEYEAQVPWILMAPVITNDGRKLYLSTLPVSFLTRSEPAFGDSELVRAVEFDRLFANQGADNLSFLSALRMSASFPYITPTISLPSEPRIEIMDAGIADNFGITDAIRTIHTFRSWISENTSGVILLVVRDTQKIEPLESRSYPSLVNKITYPISSVYNNLANIQDMNNDHQIEIMKDWLNVPLEVIEFEYDTSPSFGSKDVVKRASLSWHLTKSEKQSIVQAIDHPKNQLSLERVAGLLNADSTSIP
jgi:hypothetical protein